MRIRSLTAARLKLAPHGLITAHTAVIAALQQLNIPIETLPRISICDGWWLRRRFHRWANCWTVSVPRASTGMRERVRGLFFQTLAELQLDAVKTHRPDLHERLSLQLSTSHAATTRALRKYLLHTSGKRKLPKVLALKFWGEFKAPLIPKRSGKKLTFSKMPAHKLALLDYGSQGDWRQQAVLLLAEIHKRGAAKIAASAVIERGKAQSTVTRLEKLAAQSWRLTRADRLALGRAQARAELHNLKIAKINTLREIFQLDGRR